MIAPSVELLPDDGAFDDLGRIWSVRSGPLLSFTEGKVEHRGTISEVIDFDQFRWEADAADGDGNSPPVFAEGYASTYDEALLFILAVWACCPDEVRPWTEQDSRPQRGSSAALPWN